MHFTLILKIADNVFYTRFSGQIFSSHFLLKRITNDAFYTNSKNVLYTVVESMVYFTLRYHHVFSTGKVEVRNLH